MGTQELLLAAGVGLGDEVVVPSYATAAAAEAVRSVGATPVFADIDAASYCLAPASVAAVITARTAVIVVAELFGHPADLAALRLVTAACPLPVINHVEPLDAGSTADRDAARRRRANAAYLDARLTGVLTPVVPGGVEHRYHSYVVRVPGNGRPDRDAFARALRSRGVRCHVPVKAPVHRMPPYRRELRLPQTERAVDECLALPVDAGMTRRELHRVVSACNSLGGLLPYGAAA
ncbi:DegT/DnrJ/EryC1/StrS family aminotransferase [Streptomyces sp. AV19]|uniref:DegT/DnrJ/EryC1/StrS family aminotransferase n=1 Tax=Streptomyces sp. AV19 TaxID=2793068 RepID=UPI0018FE3B88|nr:DegT/DnrJ/EryC1/StrS family aminotransferase [Streptomyces sp. AV19]MBH1938712.1 DegT/DnrJ/EryC1/StrS family aminotransferase [Streptomyces sp. AV19]MDG4535423.1 DegT/DnrJ/EryC1/StrS family aminotransferase [Streptomyces sp. AV19]